MRRPPFISGDVVKVDGHEYLIDSPFDPPIRRMGETYIRCNVIGLNGAPWKPLVEFVGLKKGKKGCQDEDHKQKGGLLVPNTAKVIRHVRYEHLIIYLNAKAAGGYRGPGRPSDWISPTPPPIPREWTKPRYPGDPGYASHIMSDEEHRALMSGRPLSDKEKARVRKAAGLS